MARNKVFFLLTLLILACDLLGTQALASQSFTISASNTTLSSNGSGSIPYTLTSINGFEGTVYVACTAPIPPNGGKVPYCDLGGPVNAVVLTANKKATGSITLATSEPSPVPLVNNAIYSESAKALKPALAGILILSVGLGRRRKRFFARLEPVAGMLIGLIGTGICGCGGNPTLTPGNYTYTLNASADLSAFSATTTLTVTVPPGIVVH